MSKREKKDIMDFILDEKKLAPQRALVEKEREKRRARYAAYAKDRKNDQKPDDYKSTLRRFVALLAPYKWKIVFIGFIAVSGTLLGIAGPKLMGQIIDLFQGIINAKLTTNVADFSSLLQSPILWEVLAVYTLFGVTSVIQQYSLAGLTQRLICSLRESVSEKLSRLPLRFFDKNAKGDVLSKLMNNCENISTHLQNHMVTVLTSSVQVIGVLVIMLFISPILTLIPVLLVPFSSFVSFRIAKHSRKWFRKHWDTLAEITGHVEEMYTGHSIVRICNRRQRAMAEFDDIADTLNEVTRKANFISGTIAPILKLAGNLTYVAICYIGCLIIVKSTGEALSLGTLIAFISYSSMFTGPINNLANIINNIQSALASAEKVFAILDEEEEIPEKATEQIEKSDGVVEFKNVDFSYVEDKPLIKDLSIRVSQGELIAIVGPTGAGKTTLVNLLMRFYDVNAGDITIDGKSIYDLSRDNLRSVFGMVLQDTWLFQGTVRDNIAYGNPDAEEEEIIEAAKAAHIHDYIITLPEGYNTLLDEDGMNISQGQRQLLTIARAILADPAVLILDEATSSVDTRTELQIQKAMKTLMTGRTNFVIAHRLSTIKDADNILVMRRGSIVEQGTHEELMEANGFYALLHNSQFNNGIPPEDTE